MIARTPDMLLSKLTLIPIGSKPSRIDSLRPKKTISLTVQKCLRVNRRSILRLAVRRQGHYEKRLKQLTRRFRSSVDDACFAMKAAIKASRGGVVLLFSLSKIVQILCAKRAEIVRGQSKNQARRPTPNGC